MKESLHTPEGVRDIYGEECEQKLALQEKLHRVIRSFGYRDIETPTFEFFDVFGSDVGTTPSRDLYKFFDREGNTLVLRPDFTPAIARAVSRYYPDERQTLRLTYLGNTFINSSSYQGRLKETTQIGGEMIGEDSADADAELIALTVQLLLASGLTEFQISLGHCGFFDALMEESALSDQDILEIRELIINKNTFGTEKFLNGKEMEEQTRKCINSLTGLFGSVEVLEKARKLTDNKKALEAVFRLQEIYEILKIYGVEKYVSFDLGLLSRYMYYTGILFRGYTYGTGAAVLKGGRYDGLLARFGKDAPAVGFVAEIDQLQEALSAQKICWEIPAGRVMIIYEPGKQAEAILKAEELRAQGQNAELVRVTKQRTLEDCLAYARAAHADKIVF